MPGRSRKGAKAGMSGWQAFVLGMAGMLALIALWIAIFETAEPPRGERVRPIGLAQTVQAADDQTEP